MPFFAKRIEATKHHDQSCLCSHRLVSSGEPSLRNSPRLNDLDKNQPIGRNYRSNRKRRSSTQAAAPAIGDIHTSSILVFGNKLALVALLCVIGFFLVAQVAFLQQLMLFEQRQRHFPNPLLPSLPYDNKTLEQEERQNMKYQKGATKEDSLPIQSNHHFSNSPTILFTKVIQWTLDVLDRVAADIKSFLQFIMWIIPNLLFHYWPKNRCDQLFRWESMVEISEMNCVSHSYLKWYACNLGNVTLNTSKIIGSIGGEAVTDVIGRNEYDEMLTFYPGALLTNHPLKFHFEYDRAQASLYSSIIASDEAYPAGDESTTFLREGPTLLVQRGDYANPCMSIASMYNAYVAMKMFHLTLPRIVWMDGHAMGNLDDVWKTVFRDAVHVKELRSGDVLQDTIIVNRKSAFGDEGVRSYRARHQCQKDSSLHQFRDFVLQRYGMARSHTDQNRLTMLVRKNYTAHPRSDGITDRTLHNITDDMAYVQALYPKHTVQVVSFEEKSFEDQLKFITNTDVFLAVHGAGNIHALFLPDHASFVEFIPPGFKDRKRFQFLAQSLGLNYSRKECYRVDRLPGAKYTVQLRKPPPPKTVVGGQSTRVRLRPE